MSITPLMPVYPRCGVRPVRGEHCHLIDEDGTRYLDFAAGIAVNLLGHSHAGLIGAIQRQAETLMHVSNLYGSPQGEALAARLVDLTFADTVFFTNSGAEAVECAIKTARAYHQSAGNDQKYELITFNNAFHGRTMATISASNQEKMHKGFAPLLPGFKYVEFNDLDGTKAAMGPQTAGFLVEVREKGERIRTRLEQFIGNYPDLFESVRGKGLMLGLKMKVEPRPFMQHLRDNHQLLTVAAGDQTLRILPPLVIGDGEIDEFFEKLSAGAADYKPAEA